MTASLHFMLHLLFLGGCMRVFGNFILYLNKIFFYLDDPFESPQIAC